MHHIALGSIDKDILFFGGPYSNVDALEALLGRAEDHGIIPAQMISTGDTVAYCGAPNETCQLIRAQGIVTVAGNCERQLAEGALDCGCGFDEGSACDILSVGWFGYASQVVNNEHKNWMKSCPDIVTFTHQGMQVAVIHGGLSDISKFLWSSSKDDEFSQEIELIKAAIGEIDVVVSGHSGITFMRQIEGVLWVNAGVIGMPENDGRPHTRYTILHDGMFRFYDLDYDADLAQQRMMDAGLTQGYHQSLRTGYWPSEDVLPPELRVRAKG